MVERSFDVNASAAIQVEVQTADPVFPVADVDVDFATVRQLESATSSDVLTAKENDLMFPPVNRIPMYRDYHIKFDPPAAIPIRSFDYQFHHKDYDGHGDRRHGVAASLTEANAAIGIKSACVDESIHRNRPAVVSALATRVIRAAVLAIPLADVLYNCGEITARKLIEFRDRLLGRES